MTRWLIGALIIVILAGLGFVLSSQYANNSGGSSKTSCTSMQQVTLLVNFQDQSLKRLESSDEPVSACNSPEVDPANNMVIEFLDANGQVAFSLKRQLQEYVSSETVSGSSLNSTPVKVNDLPLDVLVPQAIAQESGTPIRIRRIEDQAIIAQGVL